MDLQGIMDFKEQCKKDTGFPFEVEIKANKVILNREGFLWLKDKAKLSIEQKKGLKKSLKSLLK